MIQNRLRKHFLIVAQNQGASGGRRPSWPPWDLKRFPDPLPIYVPRNIKSLIVPCMYPSLLSGCEPQQL